MMLRLLDDHRVTIDKSQVREVTCLCIGVAAGFVIPTQGVCPGRDPGTWSG